MSQFRDENFETAADVVKWLREHADDFEQVKIMVSNDITLIGPNGERLPMEGCCSQIETCTGESKFIHRDVLQEVLNDGILQRLKIPIALLPQVER